MNEERERARNLAAQRLASIAELDADDEAHRAAMLRNDAERKRHREVLSVLELVLGVGASAEADVTTNAVVELGTETPGSVAAHDPVDSRRPRADPALMKRRVDMVREILEEMPGGTQRTVADAATRRGEPMQPHNVYHVFRTNKELFEPDGRGGWRVKRQLTLPSEGGV